MIVYLEGPDGSGKSTLNKVLTDTLLEITNVISDAESLISTHPARPGRVSKKELFSRLKTMANSKDVYILDRGPISDIVYRVFDDYKSVASVLDVMNFIQTYNNRVLIIHCDSDKAEENMLKRGEDNPVALEKHKELRKVYKLFMDMLDATLPYNLIRYDYNNKLSINNVIGFTSYFVSIAGGAYDRKK